MPELDAVTQTFYANVDPYIDSIREAMRVAAEFAEANKAVSESMVGAGVSADEAALMFYSLSNQLAVLNQFAEQTVNGLRDINDEMAMNAAVAHADADAIRGVAAALVMARAAGAGGGVGGTAAATAAAGGIIARFWAQWGNVVHWVVMGTLEIAATALPALFALGTAIGAMAPAFTQLKDHFTNLITATGGFGHAVAGMQGPASALSDSMGKLNLAVAPDVWMIFGSAISIATQHTGIFASVAQQASNVLGAFATKIVTDLQGPAGTAVTGFFSNAVKDMTLWGQVLGNLGHTFVNVASAMFGVGQALLNIFVAISQVLLDISNNPIAAWLIGLGAAMSAAYRYGILLRNAFVWLGGSALVQAVRDLAGTFVILAEDIGVADASLAIFESLILGPVGLGIAAIAIGLGVWYVSTRQVSDSITQMIQSVENMSPTVDHLTYGILTFGNALKTAETHLKSVKSEAAHFGGGTEMTMATGDVNALVGGLIKLDNELKQLETGLLSTGVQTLALAQNMDVLAIQTGLQDSKVQALNQAWDQYLGLIVGGEGAAANFATTMQNMLSVTATTGIGNLGRQTQQMTLSVTDFQKALAAGPFGSDTGAAAWQNFNQMLTGSASQLASWLQTTATAGAISGGQFRMGILDAAEMMAQFTGATGPAAAAVLTYASRVDPTITSMAALDKATGGVSKAQSDLNGIINAGTTAWTNASAVAQNLSAVMNQQVTNAISAAALQASGFDTAIANMVQAQKTNQTVGGYTWQQWLSIAQGDLTAAQKAAATAAQGINTSLGTVPSTKRITFIFDSVNQVNVPFGTSIGNINRIIGPSRHGGVFGYQGGGMVSGVSGVDANLAALTAGEAVLNAAAVAALGGPLGVHTLNNKPSESVLTSGMGGGGGGISLQNHITVELDGRQLSSAWRVSQLTYDRRNPTPNTSLNRPGRPG